MSLRIPAESSQTVRHLLTEARDKLRATAFGAEPREAALLLGHVLGWNEARILAYPEVKPAPAAIRTFQDLVERRVAGAPVAYLLGYREFWGRDFAVDSRVLIPRPETEHLIEAVLDLELPHAPKILEIGTGSGCLAITLALELNGATVVATDLAPGSLALARHNAERLEAGDRVRFVASDLLNALRPESFDLIVSNPPYVARRDATELSCEILDHEPALALFGEGEDGTATLGRLLRQSAGRPLLAAEIGAGQADAVVALAQKAGWRLGKVIRDLAGIDRTLIFQSA